MVRLTATALNGGTAAGTSAALAKGAVTVMAYGKAKAAAVGALAFLLVGGGAVSVGYYVMHGDEPSPVARPDPAAAAPRNAIPDYGYSWGGPPASRPAPYQGPAVSGSVVDANGKPVAGASVTYGWDRVYASLLIDPTNPRGSYARTGPDGRFQFVPRNGKPESIAVQADEGVGMAKASDLPNTAIRLVPWGHIQGLAKIGKNPAVNARVSLRFSTRNDGPLVVASASVQTDADGRFLFDKVPPGPVDLDVTLPDGQRSVMRAHVEVQSGSTATVAMGGSGRPVIGRVNAMPAGSAGYVSLMLAPPRPPRPPAALLPPASMPTSMPSEDRQKLIAAYRESPEYQAYLKERDAFTRRYGNQISQTAQAKVAPDGTFRLEDVTPGSYQLNVSLYENDPTATGALESVGFANQPLTVPDMPGGRSDEALDVGEIKMQLQKRVGVGQTVPEIAGATADGKVVKLSDFRGKYVVLGVSRFRYTSGMANAMSKMDMCVAIRDRYRDDPRLAFVAFFPRTGSSVGLSERSKPMGVVDWPLVQVEGPLPQELTQSESILLIDPQGKILDKNLRALAAVAKVEELLGPPVGNLSAGLKIAIAHLPPGTPESAGFGTVPPISATDAATGATFSVVDGIGVEPSNSTDRLKDGRGASGDDAPSQNFFFELGTLEGRLKVDLGRTIPVAQVNTYTRHKSDRAPQVYNLYASDGAAAGFNPSPKIGVDPASVGWTKVAVVDTRTKAEAVGGRYAVGISGASGPLGRYRYLLFEIFPSETRDPYGQGFYSEIDVVEAK